MKVYAYGFEIIRNGTGLGIIFLSVGMVSYRSRENQVNISRRRVQTVSSAVRAAFTECIYDTVFQDKWSILCVRK